jgi:hypothetical protein
MNDITKARFFFNNKGSKLKDLQSFGLMMATAQSRYRDIRLRTRSWLPGNHEEVDPIEVDALVDLGVLKYLVKHNRLPDNIAEVLSGATSLEDKRDIAMVWASA